MNLTELFEALKQGFSEAQLKYRAYHGDHKFEFALATEGEVSKVAMAVFQAAGYVAEQKMGHVLAKSGKKSAYCLTTTFDLREQGGLAGLTGL